MKMKLTTGAGCVTNSLKQKGNSRFTTTLYTVHRKASGIDLTGLNLRYLKTAASFEEDVRILFGKNVKSV